MCVCVYVLALPPRSVFYPRGVRHQLCKGVDNSYLTRGGICRGVEVHTAYTLPAAPPVPMDVQYLDSVSPRVSVRVVVVVCVYVCVCVLWWQQESV